MTPAPRLRRRYAVLLSGEGTTLQAILDAHASGLLGEPPALVVANVPDAPGLERAARAGVPTRLVPHRGAPSRAAFDAALVAALRDASVELVVLAGFMRVFTTVFIDAFAGAILNTHPSLLPAFPGADAPRQAVEAGVKVSGCTIHFVEAAVDAGPIIAQVAVPVLDMDTPAALHDRIRRVERRIYPKVIEKVLRGEVHANGRRVSIDGGLI